MNSDNQSQNRSEYFQNLVTIPGVKELSDGAAATCSGGEAITLYKDANFKGDKLDLDGDDKDISNTFSQGLEDNVTSIRIRVGTWRFYTKRNFDESGGAFTLSKDSPNIGAKYNDTISSVKRIG